MDKCEHDFQYFTCGLYRCSKCGRLEREQYVKGYNTGYRIGRKINRMIMKLRERKED